MDKKQIAELVKWYRELDAEQRAKVDRVMQTMSTMGISLADALNVVYVNMIKK